MYIAGWNTPGYLPETEPEVFETFDEAKCYVLETMLFHEDSVTDQDKDLAEELSHLQQDVNLESGPFNTHCVDGLVYWVQED